MRFKLTYVIKALGRRLAWAPWDLIASLRGPGLRPPRGLSFIGGGDFEQTGREFLGYFRELGGLRPDARVLDIGCGVGRMAIPLIDYLQDGSYAGFDVGREMIAWCRRQISARRPDFEFSWAPVYNRKYNPFGTVSGAEFRFPYPDASFDFVFATSLFTHLTRADARHYLDEVARVLRPGGTSLLTFFLLDSHALEEIKAGRASPDFRYEIDGARTVDRQRPEEAIAYPLAEVREMLTAAGLRVSEPLHLGKWANRPTGTAGQDIVVSLRPRPSAGEGDEGVPGGLWGNRCLRERGRPSRRNCSRDPPVVLPGEPVDLLEVEPALVFNQVV